jgi:hypothetical protein
MRIHGTDVAIKCGTVMDKMRHFNEFFASYLRFCVLDLCFFVMEYNVVVLIIYNISYTAISIKVVTETIVKVYNMAAKRMVGIITDLNKSSRLSATLYSVVFQFETLQHYNRNYALSLILYGEINNIT